MNNLGIISLCALFWARSDGIKVSNQVHKSPTDTKEYRSVILDNRLEVLLISDPNATIAGASLAVGVGSLNDPVELPGLAHFLEHSIYLGNEKYPEVDGFLLFLSENGGSDEATTGGDYTIYRFDVFPESLMEALERFSQQFMSPLFLESALEREVSIMQTEEDDATTKIENRINRIQEHMADPSHPFSRPETGNRQILWAHPKSTGTNVTLEMRRFFDQYYSANIMRLAVMGPQSLDELQIGVQSTFSALPDKNVEMPIWNNNPFDLESAERWAIYISGDESGTQRNLHLMIPVLYHHPTAKFPYHPLKYVVYLLTHEGPTGLLFMLKQKSLANSIEAELDEYRGFTLLTVNVGLSEIGLNQTEEVICHIFRCLDFLKGAAPKEWIWEEMKVVPSLNFRYQQKEDTIDFVQKISLQMLTMPPDDVVPASAQTYGNFNASDITRHLDVISPESISVLVVSNDMNNTENMTQITEQYWGLKYYTKNISLDSIFESCQKSRTISLPKRNQFIPDDFELKPRVNGSQKEPLYIATNLSNAWIIQDLSTPKATVFLQIYSPLMYEDPISYILTGMVASVLDSEHYLDHYSAGLMGLSFTWECGANGLYLTFQGYPSFMKEFIDNTRQTISWKSIDASQDWIDSTAETFSARYEVQSQAQPFNMGTNILTRIFSEKVWDDSELLLTLKGNLKYDITPQDIEHHAKRILSRMKLYWLFYGNVDGNESLETLKNFEEELSDSYYETKPLFETQSPGLRGILLPDGTDWLYEFETTDHSSCAALYLFQFGLINDPFQSLMGLMLQQMSYYPFYNQIRTNDELGYDVGSSTVELLTTNALMFHVQGPRHPAYVFTKIEAFLDSFVKKVNSMSKESFNKYKKTFASVLENRIPHTFEQKSEVFEEEITMRRFDFNRGEKMRQALTNLRFSELKRFVNDYIATGGKKRKTIFVAVGSKCSNYTDVDPDLVLELRRSRKIIDSVPEWKEEMSFSPKK